MIRTHTPQPDLAFRRSRLEAGEPFIRNVCREPHGERGVCNLPIYRRAQDFEWRHGGGQRPAPKGGKR